MTTEPEVITQHVVERAEPHGQWATERYCDTRKEAEAYIHYQRVSTVYPPRGFRYRIAEGRFLADGLANVKALQAEWWTP